MAGPSLSARDREDAADTVKRVVVYRDRLLPFSETFILAQAQAMRSHSAVFAGRRRVDGIDLSGCELEVAGGPGVRGRGRELGHLLGHPPRGLQAALAARRPALLHAHFGPDAVNALPLQNALDVPLVVTFHGYDATQSVSIAQGPTMWLYGRRRRRLASRAARILAVSEHIRARLIALGFPAEAVQTQYIGVDVGSYRVAPLAAREPVVLGVGRFVEKKGFEHLIDAMAEVQRRLPASELVLIGTGPLGERLRRRAAAILGAHRIFGPAPAEEVRAWMRRARVLAVPSVTSRSGDTEGLPIVVLEALASGLPVIASRHAGIPEAVEDGVCGHLVGEGESVAMAHRIAAVLEEDDLWSTFSRAARAVAEERFELNARTQELEAIYEEVCEQPSNKPRGAEGLSATRRLDSHARSTPQSYRPSWRAGHGVGG